MSITMAVPKSSSRRAPLRFSNLPTLPEVTSRILALAKDPSSSPSELQQLIRSDIAMTTRILKVVNSAFYGQSRQIGSIDRAFIVLGRNAVRNIAVAASMVRIFRFGVQSETSGFDPRSLWLHSTATATAARLLSVTLGVGNVNELFLAGLTHDVGLVAQMHWAQNKFLMCLRNTQLDSQGVPRHDLCDIEQQVFGQDHASLGREVCEFWNFPDLIAELVGGHHSPLDSDDHHRTLACVIHTADRMAASLPGGFRVDLPSLEHDEAVLAELGLDPQRLPDLARQLQVEMREVSSLLSEA